MLFSCEIYEKEEVFLIKINTQKFLLVYNKNNDNESEVV